jgi:uncharacterized protein (DUF1697 family)
MEHGEVSVRYAVFLRGINVGGHKPVVMAQLTKSLEALGCTEVKTLLNSGNVVLTSKKSAAGLEKDVVKAVGFELEVLVWTAAELTALVESEPFADTAADLKQYVCFAKRPVTLKLPVRWAKFGLEAFAGQRRALFLRSFPVKNPRPGYPTELEREVGPTTTRTWNTVLKVHAAAQL